MNNEFPKRKHPRLKEYDYSSNGYYFITVNSYLNKPLFSEIIEPDTKTQLEHIELAVKIILTDIGNIVEAQLTELENRFSGLHIEKYVIMPTHIHALIILDDCTAGASPRPTLMDAVCTFKSLSTRIYNQQNKMSGQKIWQTSFYDRVITCDESYYEVLRYIEENPAKWRLDKYYTA